MTDPQHQPERRFYRFWNRHWQLSIVLTILGIIGIMVGILALVWAF